MEQSELKQELREELLQRRLDLGKVAYLEKSNKILTSLKRQPEFMRASVIHCYLSINERNEVNTHPLIKEMIAEGKNTVVPVTHFEEGTLSHRYLHDFDDLQKNKWNVLEPAKGQKACVDDFELVIVPMVGGDKQKNRIGYGKGFYDRFLKDVSCNTIGLLFECCLVESVPVEPFDIALDKCITESNIIL